LAVSYLAVERFDKAAEALDRAYPSALRGRTLIINRAILDIAQRINVTRGIKELKEYFAKNPASDETALNVFGAGVGMAGLDERFFQTPYYQSLLELYGAKNKELEARRPGEGRWGNEWLSGALLKQKVKQQEEGFKKYQEAFDRERYAEGLLKQAQTNLDALVSSGQSPAQAYSDMDKATSNLRGCTEAHRDAWKKIPRPDWPIRFPPVLPEAIGGGAFGSAAPARIIAVTPMPVPTPASPKPASPKPKPSSKTPSDEPKTTIVTAMPPVAPATPVSPPVDPRPMKRTVSRSAVAVPVGPDLFLTAAGSVDNATDFLLESPGGDALKGELVRKDPALGLALLRLPGQHLPYLNLAAAVTPGEVVCWGFPDVSIFNPVADSFTGTASAPKATGWTINLRRHPRLAGAAVLDKFGKLAGIALGERDTVASLIPAVGVDQIRAFLGADAPKSACSNPNPQGVMQLTASHEAQ
jgi:hypothetical protein